MATDFHSTTLQCLQSLQSYTNFHSTTLQCLQSYTNFHSTTLQEKERKKRTSDPFYLGAKKAAGDELVCMPKVLKTALKTALKRAL
jgi:hypothetical protein